VSAPSFLRRRPVTTPVPAATCADVLVHPCGPASVRYACTLAVGHAGLHEHRPRPDRMAVAQWR
jgi:hypothetical protein